MVLAMRLGSPPGVHPFLPLYPTRSMSAASHSSPLSASVSSPVFPLELLWCSSRGWSSVPHPMLLVEFGSLFSIPSFHHLVATLVVLRYLASASAPMLVQSSRSRRNLGILGVS